MRVIVVSGCLRFRFGTAGMELGKGFAFAVIGRIPQLGRSKTAPTVGLSKIGWSKEPDYLLDNRIVSILSQAERMRARRKWVTRGASSRFGNSGTGYGKGPLPARNTKSAGLAEGEASKRPVLSQRTREGRGTRVLCVKRGPAPVQPWVPLSTARLRTPPRIDIFRPRRWCRRDGPLYPSSDPEELLRPGR
jgi:hypothetical protein